MTDRNGRLNVAHVRLEAITSRINPTSSGSLIGVLNLTIDKAPRRPKDRGIENCRDTKIAVIATPNNGKAL
jgi:hypothetical protein